MRYFAVDYTVGGEIVRVCNIAAEADAVLIEDGTEQMILVVDDFPDFSVGSHYVNNGNITTKQPLVLIKSATQIFADGTNEAVITGVPTGVSVTWPDGQTDEITDGEVRFSVDLPGTYTLTFSAIPYLTQEVTIEAIPAT